MSSRCPVCIPVDILWSWPTNFYNTCVHSGTVHGTLHPWKLNLIKVFLHLIWFLLKEYTVLIYKTFSLCFVNITEPPVFCNISFDVRALIWFICSKNVRIWCWIVDIQENVLKIATNDNKKFVVHFTTVFFLYN